MADKREIRFRGKRDADGEWTYGLSLKIKANGKMPVTAWISRLYHRGEWEQVDPATVGQFTGLRDKNGVEIYEGDVIQGWFAGIKGKYKIIYGDDASYYGESAPYNNIEGAGTQTVGLNNVCDWAEVIGNVWDHPHLLEVANNG